MRRMTAARARAALLLLGMTMAAGCRRAETTDVAWRFPLAQPAAPGATLAVDSARVVWIGSRGRLVGVDSAGRAVSTITTGGDSVPRLLWRSGGRLVLALGSRWLAQAQAI